MGSRAPGPQGGGKQPELVLCCHPVAIRVNCSSHRAACFTVTGLFTNKCGLGGSEQAASQPHFSPSIYILNPLTTSGPL